MIYRYSSVVERTALNRVVEGSIPSAGVDEDQIIPTAKSIYFDFFKNLVDNEKSSSNSVG